jgi:hypothetical protein
MPKLLNFANSKNKPYQFKSVCVVLIYQFHFQYSCFAAYSDSENDFLVLDDLAKYGYTTVSRQSGLSLNDCQKCLQSLGRFHGLSLAFRDQHPAEFEKLTNQIE